MKYYSNIRIEGEKKELNLVMIKLVLFFESVMECQWQKLNDVSRKRGNRDKGLN